MKKSTKKLKKKKVIPIYHPNGDIENANDLMLDYDFDNDPVFKAKLEEAKADFRKNPPPGLNPADIYD